MNDKLLRDDILTELDFEPIIDATNIGVAVSDGVVTLTGHVGSFAQKVAVERAVKRIKGVRAVAQEVEVRGAYDKKISDDEIAKRAANIILWNTLIPDDAVQSTVSGGWVTLTGQVEWQYQKDAAESAVRKLSGVLGVFNHISIKSHVSVDDIKSSIESALKRYAEIEAKGIRVTVNEGGTVTLDGIVHDWHERQAVNNAAWSARGVNFVQDHLVTC